MLLVLDNEVDPEYRYLGPEIARLLPDSDYRVSVEDPVEVDLDDYDGVVLSGSTDSVYADDHGAWFDREIDLIRRCVRDHIPLLGICYGHQLINHALGGTVERDRRRATFVELVEYDDSDILSGVTPIVPVLNQDLVVERGDAMESIARTANDPNCCTRHREAPVYTVQFHPEFTARVSDQSHDWDPGAHSFAECTADRVLDNFAALVDGGSPFESDEGPAQAIDGSADGG